MADIVNPTTAAIPARNHTFRPVMLSPVMIFDSARYRAIGFRHASTNAMRAKESAMEIGSVSRRDATKPASDGPLLPPEVRRRLVSMGSRSFSEGHLKPKR
jgi:hypothetical protein